MSQGQRRLAAIMFTDMAGYTSLSESNETLAMELLEEHRKIARPFFLRHKGREIKTMGDAFLVEFESALEAVRCAFELQQSFHELNTDRPSERQIQLRIGVHLGDVIHARNDVYGDAVNLASRMEPLASPGGICVSAQVYDHIKNKFEFPIVSIGSHQLKNVQLPVEVYRMALPWEKGEPGSSPAFDKHRLAVLPFSNISADPSDDYFADGMTEELIATTSAISGLTVIARTSVMRYKGLGKSVSEIGKELRVGSLMEGSVRKAGDRLRITVQLIDVQTEGHMWAQSYDRRMEDIFAVQAEIAKQVANSLQLRLMEKERRSIEDRGTQNREAYNFYLKGRYFWNERTQEGLKKAISYFESSLKSDPDYALAYAGLASSYELLASYGYVAGDVALPKAKSFALKALELDETSAEAHAALGMILADLWDMKGMGRELRMALQLNPSYASAHQWYGDYLFYVEGRFEEANKEKFIARDLDPFSPVTNLNIGGILLEMKHYGRAIEEFKKALELFPDYWSLHNMLAYAYTMNGDYEKALAEHEKAFVLSPNKVMAASFLATDHAHAGKKDEAIKLIEELRTLAHTEFVDPAFFAYPYAALEEKDEAFRWLEKAYEKRSTGLPQIRYDPILTEKLGSDPRWHVLMRKLGYDK